MMLRPSCLLTGRCRGRLLLVLVAAALVGCSSEPRGGRIDPYQTTAADRASTRANIPALLEFCDQTAQALAGELADLPAVKNAPTRLVLELGTIDNHTHTPTSDFEQIQHRLRGQLMQSRLVQDNFIIVENRQRMNEELQRITGGAAPAGQKAPTGTAVYDPKITYVLQGDFYESDRSSGNMHRGQFYFEFHLVNLASREIIPLHSYDLGQVTPR